jgi:hypothetical protein
VRENDDVAQRQHGVNDLGQSAFGQSY